MDSEAFIREWTRAKVSIAPERVYFSLPEHDSPDLPLIAISRQGGPRTIYFDNPYIVWDVWAVNKYAASQLAGQLADAIIHQAFATPFTVAGETIRWEGSSDPTILPLPKLPWAKRYQVAASVWLRL